MDTAAPPDVPACDSLYLSAHPGEAALACALRMSAERARGLRLLVLTAFAAEGEDGDPSAPRLVRGADGGADALALGLPSAGRREPYYGSFRAARFGRHPDDESWIGGLARRLADLLPRLRPREVYVPLGVGGHVDHRICHEAALRVIQSGGGRNVFLYEERPESFVPGAVRVRLGQVGARLPPAASAAASEGGLARFLLGFHTAPHVRAQAGGVVERFRCTGEAARDWREARAWHPQRAFGPRLQPLVQPPTPAGVEALRALASAAGRSGAALVGRAEAYARRLGAAEHAERYWLLLPVREDEGRAIAAAGGAEPLAV